MTTRRNQISEKRRGFNQPYTLIDWTGATPSGVDLADFVVTGGPTSPMPTLSIVGSTLQVVVRPLGTMISFY
jgi:hypothetical protein